MCKIKGLTFRIISASLIFFLLLSFVLPNDALASRSRAGGGDVPEFSFSDFAVTAGIGVGTAVVGAAFGSALGSAWDGIKGGLDAATIASNMGGVVAGSFNSLPSFTTTMISGYNTFMAGTQVARAVSAVGAYQEWNPATTFIVSSIATGVTAGTLNPAYALGGVTSSIGTSTILEGAFIGGLGGLASSEVQVLIDRDRISEGRNPGAGAQIAGFTAGFVVTTFGRNLFNSKNYLPDANKDTHIVKNIVFNSAKQTFNAWPMLATNALGTWAASRVDDSYSQMIKVGINSVGGVVLDAFANSQGLRLMYSSKNNSDLKFVPARSSFKEELGKSFSSSSIKYMILSNLLSGGISAATNALIGSADRNTGTYDDPMKSMLVSLAGVVGTSIARGVAWNVYNDESSKIAAQNGLQVSDMGATIGGSISQGLYEFGSQSLAMGLPYAPGGALNTPAWVNYTQNLSSATRAAASIGFWQVMENNVISTGKDVINRNISTGVANTPLGSFIGMAPFVTVTGYKDQPFSAAPLYMDPRGNIIRPSFSESWPISYRLDDNSLNKSLSEIQRRARQDIGR